MTQYRKFTCIRFVPRTDQSDYIKINKLDTTRYVYALPETFISYFDRDPLIVVCPHFQQFQLLFIVTLKRVELEIKIDLTVVTFQLKTEFP
jgi:hypothetical protein